MSNKIKLYSAWYCPFAQRVWLALLLKGIDFEYIEIDPYKKTPEWMRISAGSGQVPVLEYFSDDGKKTTLVDSLKIVEFIGDTYPNDGQKIMPDEAIQKADVTFWMNYVNTQIVPYFYRFLKADKPGEKPNDEKRMMLNGLEQFSRSMSTDGPFFSGSEINAIDIAFAPFAYRIQLLLNYYRNFTLPENTASWLRYKRWYEAVIADPAFIESSLEQDNYQSRLIEFYLPYSLGGGQADVTEIKLDG